jgi:hypothetical protein
MAKVVGPGGVTWGWPEGSDHWGDEMDANLQKLDAITHTQRTLEDFGGVGDDATDNTDALALAVADGAVVIPDGKFRIPTEIPTNTRGVPVTGPGSLMVPVDQGDLTKGYHRYAFVEDEHQRWFGLEYLFPLHSAWKASTSAAPKLYMCGDSTINGDSIVQTEWLPDNALRAAIQRRGFKATIVKKAVSGSTVAEFDAQMSNAEIDDAVSIIISFGINDTFPPPDSWDFVGVPGAGVPKYASFDAFVDAYRAALARIRARRSELECAIVIKTSNVVNDTQHNRDEWQAHRQRRALRKLARDYKCCLIDIPMYVGDTRPNPLIDSGRTVMPTGKWSGVTQLAPGWMDDPFRTIEGIRDPRCYGNGIHPLETANIWIWGIVADILCGTVREIASNNWMIDPTAELNPSTTPDLYPAGASTYRARFADGWPLDGIAHTIKDTAGNCIQWHYATGADNADYYVRLSKNGTTWGRWETNWWVNDTTLDANASSAPNLYRFGATTYRAKISEGWPVEGYVHTIREPLVGNAVQWNWSMGSKAPSLRHRVSYDDGANWGAWSVFTETPTLLNGWANVASTTQFRLTRRNGMAHLSGIIGSGTNTIGTVLFTLPAGAAPRDDIFLMAWDVTGTGFGVIKIVGTGNDNYDLTKNVEVYSPSATGYYNLSGCSWQTAYEL